MINRSSNQCKDWFYENDVIQLAGNTNPIICLIVK